MSEIAQGVPPLQLEGLQDKEAMRHMAVYIETQTNRMQREIYQLRQFIEPLVKNNENCPEQEFNPLT